MSSAVSIVIVSGFLGTGKTTFVNRILKENHGFKTAVLVNDFGDLNIDADILDQEESDVVSVKNGCVCCSLQSDLVHQVALLIDKEQFDYLVIESSGVSEPGNIVRTLEYPQLRSKVSISAVVTMIDAELFLLHVEKFKYLLNEQLAAADLLLLNKVDLVSEQRLNKVIEHCSCPGLPIVQCTQADISLEILFSTKRVVRDSVLKPQEVGADRGYSSKTWFQEQAIDLQKLKLALKKVSVDVLRIKGFVRANNPSTSYLVQVVGQRINLTPCETEQVHGLVLIAQSDKTDWLVCFDELNTSIA